MYFARRPMVLLATLLSVSCLLGLPADGPVVRGFAPQGPYGGHWGVDVAVDPGTPVRAVAAGVVTFSGSIAGNQTVTVSHGGGVRTSYSYLSARYVTGGHRVAIGGAVGASGVDHGVAAIHFSLRVGDRYVDPLASCRTPSPGLRLASAVASYPVARAPRSSRRNLRSAAYRSSGRRRGGVPSPRPR